MKKKLLNGLLMVSGVLLLAGCATSLSATDYNNKIVDIDTEIVTAENAIVDAWNNDDTAALQQAYAGLTTALDNAEKNMTTLGAYKDDTSFYDVVMKYIADKKALHNGDEKKLYDLMAQYEAAGDAATEAQYDEINALDTKVQEEYKKMDDAFVDAQEAFATKYNFELAN